MAKKRVSVRPSAGKGGKKGGGPRDAKATKPASGEPKTEEKAASSGGAPKAAATSKPSSREREPAADESVPESPPEDELDAPSSKEALPEPPHPETHGAPWALPLVKIERAWTWFEMRLLLVVIVSLIAAMVSWVSLKGLSSPVESEARAGTMYRAMLGAIVLGSITHAVTRRIKLEGRAAPAAVLGAMVLGAGVAPMWRATGVDYFGRMLNWLQEGSSLTMFGGLRGVSTRLTIVLAMVGASLAAANGKHINIDALLRFMRPQLRIVSFVLSSIATIAVCVAAAWGFTDYISIESFGANKDASRGEKISHVTHHLSQDFFLWRKQVGFDLEALPVVVGGGKWDDEKRMNGRQWNEFLDESGYYDHFDKTDVDALRSPEEDLDAPRVPQVVVPDGTARGLLVHALNLIFPIGLLLVAARFFLRMLLVVTGHQSVEVEGELLHSADSLAREDEQATESEPPETKAEAPDAKKSAAKAASAKKSAAKEESADADDGEDAGEGASDDADAPADSDAPAKSDATAEGEPADADGSEDEVKS